MTIPQALTESDWKRWDGFRVATNHATADPQTCRTQIATSNDMLPEGHWGRIEWSDIADLRSAGLDSLAAKLASLLRPVGLEPPRDNTPDATAKPLQSFQIWSEGHVFEGRQQKAQYHGRVSAESFRDACERFWSDEVRYDGAVSLFNRTALTYAGRALYRTEEEARARYG